MAGEILLAFYGDDFSGTTATAEALFESGTPTVIFTVPPELSLLSRHFPKVRAVGVAGLTRTLAAEELEGVLEPALRTLGKYLSSVILYKICSTFDSSEQTGSIGRAIEIGRRIFDSRFVPVLPAAPRLGRFTVFGHQFAALGGGEVYRLDRHPSMSVHPVTPMRESDLRLHLARQTDLKSALISVLDLNRGRAHVKRLLLNPEREKMPIVFFDCIEEKHLRLACQVIWANASPQKPIFFVGSQEVGYGLGHVWKKSGLLPEKRTTALPASIHREPIFVLSGSCATVTGSQIRWSIENGFEEIDIRPEWLVDPSKRQAEQERVAEACLHQLGRSRSVVAHTAVGPNDPRIGATREKTSALALSSDKANRLIGDALGEIARRIFEQGVVRRIVVSGGDTAGRIQKHLDVLALQIARPVGIAAPLCYMYSSNRKLNGAEVAFKGGQIGRTEYFGQVQSASTRGFESEALGTFP